MSQGPLTIADGSGAGVLAAINAAFARLATKASGTGRPSDIATGEFWIETDNPGAGVWSLWLYDGASDILFATINSSTHSIAYTSAGFDALLGSTKGMLAKRGASSWAGLAVSSAFSALHVNSAGDDLEWRRQGWEKIADDAVPAGVGSVDFTGIPANAKALAVVFELLPASNAVLLGLRLSTAASFDTGANYDNSALSNGSAGAGGSYAASDTYLALGASVASDTTYGGVTGQVLIPNPQAGRYKRIAGLVSYDDTANSYAIVARGGRWRNTGVVDGVRLFFSSGNIAGGRVSLLGLRA